MAHPWRTVGFTLSCTSTARSTVTVLSSGQQASARAAAVSMTGRGTSVAMTLAMHNLLAAALLMTACGTDVTHDDTTDAGSNADGYTTLITNTWQLPPSTEKYLCVR